MELVRRPVSPNHTPQAIDVQFLILHYTAVDLARTLEIFYDPDRKAAAHLIVDRDGTVHECVPCLDGTALRAWHAGQSRWQSHGKLWEGLNDCAIGIELVNFNGNLLPYTAAQYSALAAIVDRLRRHYPPLNDATRVLGHEQVAGWRGKADPGWRFDWPHFYATCYPGQPAPERTYACPPTLREALERLSEVAPLEPARANAFWERVSLLTETAVALAAGQDG